MAHKISLRNKARLTANLLPLCTASQRLLLSLLGTAGGTSCISRGHRTRDRHTPATSNSRARSKCPLPCFRYICAKNCSQHTTDDLYTLLACRPAVRWRCSRRKRLCTRACSGLRSNPRIYQLLVPGTAPRRAGKRQFQAAADRPFLDPLSFLETSCYRNVPFCPCPPSFPDGERLTSCVRISRGVQIQSFW